MDEAYQKAQPGDVVEMAPGDYPGQTISPRSLPGEDGLGPSGEEITFKGPAASIDGMILSTPRGAPVERVNFEGMTFVGWVGIRSARDVHFLGTKHRAQLHANWVSYLSYQGVEVGPFTDDTGDGLQFNQIDDRAGDHILVQGSRIHDVHPDNDTAHPDAVQLYGAFDDFTFRGNSLWNNDNINYRGDPTMDRLVVENNFFGEARNPVVPRYYSAQILGNGAVVRYNSFAGALQPSAPGEGADQLWEGNVMTWTTCKVSESSSTVRFNVFVGGVRCGSSAKLVGDAGFVDERGGDLHLTPSSPAVAAGNPASFPGADVDGEARPAHGLPDAGADEWDAAGAPPGQDTPIAPKRGRLIIRLHVTRDRRGYVVRLRLARRARVGLWVDRRVHGRYRAVRHLKLRALKAGNAHMRLGRLHRARYRLRLVAVEPGGHRSHRKLRFKARRHSRRSA
jgi:hypothetical protein